MFIFRECLNSFLLNCFEVPLVCVFHTTRVYDFSWTTNPRDWTRGHQVTTHTHHQLYYTLVIIRKSLQTTTDTWNREKLWLWQPKREYIRLMRFFIFCGVRRWCQWIFGFCFDDFEFCIWLHFSYSYPIHLLTFFYLWGGAKEPKTKGNRHIDTQTLF